MREVWRVERGVLVGFFVGALVALLVYGPAFVLGVGPFWEYAPTDPSSHLVGYREFVLDAWRLPLAHSRLLEPPDGLNLLYTDSIPLLSLVLKAVGPLVPNFARPTWFSPLGAWHLFAYAMQGAMGARLVRETTKPSLRYELTGAIFAVATPVFVGRVMHVALMSHFLILAAFLFYIQCTRGLSLKGAMVRWGALFFALTLIHPYLLVMCGLIFAATLCVWLMKGRARDAILLAAVPAGVVVPVVYLAGYLSRRITQGGDWGFGYKSTYLSSFVIPQASALIPWTDPALKIDMIRGEGSEGYAWLGVGVLLLAVFTLVVAPRELGRTIKRHPALSIVVVLSLLYALSNRIVWGTHVLAELPVPTWLSWFTRQFRASGRFVWIPIYALQLLLLTTVIRSGSSRRVALAAPIFAIAQALDTTGTWRVIREYTSVGERRYLPWEIVDPIIASHPTVSFVPSFECIPLGHPFDIWEHMEIETMASRYGVAIGSVRSSRPLRNCARDAIDLGSRSAREGELWFLYDPASPAAHIAHYERQGLACFRLRRGTMCSTRFTSEPPPGLERESPDLDYKLGEEVKLGDESSAKYLGLGWSFAESSHRWSLGERSYVFLRASEPVPSGARLVLSASGRESVARSPTVVDVWINGVRAHTIQLGSQVQTFELPLPSTVVDTRVLELELRPHEFRSPKTLGIGTDTRELGLAVGSIRIDSH